MFIRSERLFLRPAWPEDWSEINDALGNDARAFAAKPQAPRHPRFLITLPDHLGAHVVGSICFSAFYSESEMCVWIGRDWRGRGYATEAARAALSLVRTLGHRRLVAAPIADCPGSGLLLARLGFVPTGQVCSRYKPAREVHVLELCPPACDALDPSMFMHAA